MMPAIRLVSSSTNFLYSSPLKKIGDQPSFSSVVFHAADSVAPRIDLDQRIALRGGDARSAENAAPIGQLDVEALFLERWISVDFRRARHCERAHAPAFDLLGEFADAGNTGGNVAADDGRDRLAAAFKRHVIDFCRIDARRLGDQSNEYVIGAAGRAAAPGDAAGIGFEGFDQVAHVLVRRVCRHDDDLVLAGEAGERRHHGEIDRRVLQIDGADHHHAADHDRRWDRLSPS